MRLRKVGCSVLLVLTSIVGRADDIPAPLTIPLAQTPTRLSPIEPATLSAIERDTAVEHIMQAAHHLEAAGLPDEANRVRERAEEMLNAQRLRELKLELARIQGEIQRLEGPPGPPGVIIVPAQALHAVPHMDDAGVAQVSHAQVILKCRIVKMPVDQFERIEQEFEKSAARPLDRKPGTDAKARALLGCVMDAKQTETLTKLLTPSKSVRTIAEPTVVTTFGRAAQVDIGGEFPIAVPRENNTVAVEFRQFGTSLKLLPICLKDGRLKLQVEREVADRDSTNATTVSGVVIPALNVRRSAAQAEMPFDDTLVYSHFGEADNQQTSDENSLLQLVAGIKPQSKEKPESAQAVTLIMITPSLVDATD